MGDEVMVIVIRRQGNIIEDAEAQQAFLVKKNPDPRLDTDCDRTWMESWLKEGMLDGNNAVLRRGGDTTQTINEGKDKTVGADNEEHLLALRHPKSDASTSYLYKDGLLLELQWFKQSYGSWFLGDYVCADGSLYVATPVDPVFIFLPIFSDARLKKGTDLGMFRQIDEILYVEGYPAYRHLMRMAEDSMQLVCEVKEVGSSKFFRLDDSKVLSWLCCKVLQLKASLEKLDKNYAIQDEKETSSKILTTKRRKSVKYPSYPVKEIVSILGDYMKYEPWLTKLCSHLKLSLDDAIPKAEPDAVFIEETLVPSHSVSSGKVDAGRTKSSKGKQPKKLKTETDSRNIKDMFRSASKRRT